MPPQAGFFAQGLQGAAAVPLAVTEAREIARLEEQRQAFHPLTGRRARGQDPSFDGLFRVGGFQHHREAVAALREFPEAAPRVQQRHARRAAHPQVSERCQSQPAHQRAVADYQDVGREHSRGQDSRVADNSGTDNRGPDDRRREQIAGAAALGNRIPELRL